MTITSKNNMIAIRDLEMTKERLLSFAEYAKDAQPEVLVTLIQTIVERIYIVDKDDERFCHIFIKGCTDEDYTGFFQTAGYIEQNTTPVCDSEQYCIRAEIQEIYGKIKQDIGQMLRKLCEYKGIEIHEAEASKDHIHMLVSIPPKYSVSQIMGYQMCIRDRLSPARSRVRPSATCLRRPWRWAVRSGCS